MLIEKCKILVAHDCIFIHGYIGNMFDNIKALELNNGKEHLCVAAAHCQTEIV